MIALKIIDLSVIYKKSNEDILDEVNNEIQVLKDCKNPRITNFHESFIHDSRLYIVMEYVAGGSIKDILRVRGSL
jgi:serine/threonine-protein kinase 24/25/MST4